MSESEGGSLDLSQPDVLASGYDAVYTAFDSPTLRRLWHELAEGPDFPEEFGHISLVTLPQLRRMCAELSLAPGEALVDLGCGGGGPALWVAAQTEARLVGVDFSAVAVQQATARAARLGLAEQARFVVGSFSDSGLDGGSVDAIMSEDALQYAPDKRAAMAEAARILRPGGRLVFTSFELEPERATPLPVFGVDPTGDFRPLLEQAGFRIDAYEEAPGWPEPLTTTYSSLLDASEDLRQEMGEQAATALCTELSLTLQQKPYRRRVLSIAAKAE